MSSHLEKNISFVDSYSLEDLSLPESLDKSGGIALSLFSRVYRQNSRSGNVYCKGRSDLTSRANKKPWRQKGTGRARAGTPRSPLWRGGAVSHGPKFRSKKLSVPRRLYKLAMLHVLSQKNLDGKIFVINNSVKNSCSDAKKYLSSAGIYNKRIILLHEANDYETILSFSNIKNVGLASYSNINAYSIAMFDLVVFFKKDESLFNCLVKSCLC
jgi:large subunit ribosomal protein L4